MANVGWKPGIEEGAKDAGSEAHSEPEIVSLDEVRAYVLGVAISGWRPVQRLIRLNGGVE